MADEPLPTSIGGAGLTGRTQIVRIPDVYEDPESDTPRAPGRAIPPNCLRTLSSPLGHDCATDCPGRQRDGGCLCDIVRAANAAGVEWKFEIDPRDDSWLYAGPPLDGFETVAEVAPVEEPKPDVYEFVFGDEGAGIYYAVPRELVEDPNAAGRLLAFFGIYYVDGRWQKG